MLVSGRVNIQKWSTTTRKKPLEHEDWKVMHRIRRYILYFSFGLAQKQLAFFVGSDDVFECREMIHTFTHG